MMCFSARSDKICLTVGHDRSIARAMIRMFSERSLVIACSTNVNGNSPIVASAAQVSTKPPPIANVTIASSSSSAGLLQALDRGGAADMLRHLFHGCGLDVVGGFPHGEADCFLGVRIGGFEFDPNGFRGARHQCEQHVRRNVRPAAHTGGKAVVVFGALHQHGKAEVGKARAAVAHRHGHDVAVAALDQHRGDGLAQRPAMRNRQHVALAFLRRQFDKSLLVEPRRLRQDRAGDLDGIVERQRANDFRRRIGKRREPGGQQHLRGLFDLGGKAPDHVIEQHDIVVGEPRRAEHEQIRDPLQNLRAPFGRAIGDGVFEFANETEIGAHHRLLELLTTCWVPSPRQAPFPLR